MTAFQRASAKSDFRANNKALCDLKLCATCPNTSNSCSVGSYMPLYADREAGMEMRDMQRPGDEAIESQRTSIPIGGQLLTRNSTQVL